MAYRSRECQDPGLPPWARVRPTNQTIETVHQPTRARSGSSGSQYGNPAPISAHTHQRRSSSPTSYTRSHSPSSRPGKANRKIRLFHGDITQAQQSRRRRLATTVARGPSPVARTDQHRPPRQSRLRTNFTVPSTMPSTAKARPCPATKTTPPRGRSTQRNRAASVRERFGCCDIPIQRQKPGVLPSVPVVLENRLQYLRHSLN